MAETPNPSKGRPGTLAVAALATCCGVKLVLLASAGTLTAGLLGRTVAVFGLGAVVLVGLFFVLGRRRAMGEACRPPLPRHQLGEGSTGGVSEPARRLEGETDGALSDSAPSTK